MKTKEQAHALLSASGAKKWMNCTASARLEEQLPEKPSEYASEGTLAHEICELKLRKEYTETSMSSRAFTTRFNKLKKHDQYQKEMDGFTDIYVNYINLLTYNFPTQPYVAIEKKIDYSNYAPEGFGTADCVIIHQDTCYVIDFKYGKGIKVYADNNPQMMLYGLGVLNDYGYIYNIQKVVLVVVQPRLDSISEWEVAADDLRTWGKIEVKPAAELAFKGEGGCNQGEWCDSCFCNASALCSHRRDENMELEEYIDPISGKLPEPKLLTNEEVGAIIARAQFLAKWVKKLESFALSELVKGNAVPGWKIVEGRSNRAFADQDGALENLIKSGYDESVLYNKVPLSLSGLESLLTKEEYNTLLAPYVTKPHGAPTLAVESDKRPAFSSAEASFGGENAIKQ